MIVKHETPQQQPDTIDLPAILHDAWDAAQEIEKQFHIHPENQEGASGLGGCIAIRAKRGAGIKMPKPEGAKADWGAMYVGNSTHYKLQRDAVPLLQKAFPDLCIGPIIDENGHIHEVMTETEILAGRKVLSPLDLCVATPPGFVIKTVPYRNVNRDVHVLAPGAKFVKIWDIKSTSNFAFDKYQEEGLGPMYTAQGLDYLHATGLPSMTFVFINKQDYHMFTIDLAWSDDAWQALQAKRQREIDLTGQLKSTGNADWRDDDFFYNTQKGDYHCAYCPLSTTHEEEGVGKMRVILDLPCPEVVARKTAEFTAMFTVDSHWMSGLSMITIDAVHDGKVFSHNKGGKAFEDTIFHAGKSYVAGWEKKEKPAPEPVAAVSPVQILATAPAPSVDGFRSMLERAVLRFGGE